MNTTTADGDRGFLLDLADTLALMVTTNGELRPVWSDDDQVRLLAIAEQLKNPKTEIVEQRTAMKTAGAAPDGWSWTDLHNFHGYYSGVRAQRGEPILEQDGNNLLLRQGEVSFEPRQVPIYERLSLLEGVSVIVVFGFLGARKSFVTFYEGKQSALRPADELEGAVLKWLQRAHAHPIEGWERKVARQPRSAQMEL